MSSTDKRRTQKGNEQEPVYKQREYQLRTLPRVNYSEKRSRSKQETISRNTVPEMAETGVKPAVQPSAAEGMSNPPQGAVRKTDDVINDVTDDVTAGKQIAWNPAYESSLTDFALVRDNYMSIQEWKSCTQDTLRQFWGPKVAIIVAVAKNVNFKEFKTRTFIPARFKSVEDFLDYVMFLWTEGYYMETRKVILRKKPEETWCEFLDRILAMVAGMSVKPTDEWCLQQMRGNIQQHQDRLPTEEKSARKWARYMDMDCLRYDRPQESTVAVVEPDPSADEEDVVDSVKRSDKYRFNKKRKPICFNCHRIGHMARDCPNSRNHRGRGRGGFSGARK